MKTYRNAALVAGVAIIVMAVVAGITYGYIHNTLVDPKDAVQTFENIRTNRLTFILEIFGWFFILLLDLIVAWALYLCFKNETKHLSLIMAGLRLVFAVVFGVAIFHLIPVLNIANESITSIQDTISEQSMNLLHVFESTWSISLIVFGFHLFALGILVFRTTHIHNFWGIVLLIAAVSYAFIHAAKFLFPESEDLISTIEMVLILPMTFGEVGFAFWLLVRGGKTKAGYLNSKLF